jgi:hypothetical protein
VVCTGCNGCHSFKECLSRLSIWLLRSNTANHTVPRDIWLAGDGKVTAVPTMSMRCCPHVARCCHQVIAQDGNTLVELSCFSYINIWNSTNTATAMWLDRCGVRAAWLDDRGCGPSWRYSRWSPSFWWKWRRDLVAQFHFLFMVRLRPGWNPTTQYP